MKHDENTAVVIGVWKLYNDNVDASNGIIHYFLSLQPKNKENNKHLRLQRLDSSTRCMTIRYREISNLQYCDILYENFVVEWYRRTITRWRMSCHKSKQVDTPDPKHLDKNGSVYFATSWRMNNMLSSPALHTYSSDNTTSICYPDTLLHKQFYTLQQPMTPTQLESICSISKITWMNGK